MAYTAPTPEDFLERFPEFSDLYESNAFLQLLLDEAGRRIDTTWLEQDYATAIMYLAAHLLQMHSMSVEGEGLGIIRSESLGRISLSYGGVDKAVGDLSTTTYGNEYKKLLKLNFPAITTG